MSDLYSVLVTGSNGGIGTEICKALKKRGYFVIGSDIKKDNNNLDGFILNDIRELVHSNEARSDFFKKYIVASGGKKIFALINNAAVQLLGSVETLDIDDFKKSFDVNVTAPLVLTKLFFDELKINKGSVVNIGSIHARLTKPGFVSYSSSKAALLGLTQSLAVDAGHSIRVNAIQPAATATDMLLDGFKGTPDKLSELKKFHPTNSIAKPEEIANAVEFLISSKCQFMNGTILDINGGIGARLHDPV
jgi:NAD(P)-dependent dehydrogenase (short-subunit alcohol dehydrogenase family)